MLLEKGCCIAKSNFISYSIFSPNVMRYNIDDICYSYKDHKSNQCYKSHLWIFFNNLFLFVIENANTRNRKNNYYYNCYYDKNRSIGNSFSENDEIVSRIKLFQLLLNSSLKYLYIPLPQFYDQFTYYKSKFHCDRSSYWILKQYWIWNECEIDLKVTFLKMSINFVIYNIIWNMNMNLF